MTTELATEGTIASLGPFEQMPGWLVAAMQPEFVAAALLRGVPELRTGQIMLLACEPERLRAKGAEWLARYRLSLAEPGGARRDVTMVGKLHPPGEADETRPAVDGMPGSGAGFGAAGWCGWLPELRLQLTVSTSDEALPALPSVTHPGEAARLLEPVLREAGYAAALESCQPQVVRYKPGSRCTVVVRMQYAATNGQPLGPDPVVLKIHHGDKGRTAWEAMRALWTRPIARGDIVTLAEPLGYLPEPRILVQGPIPEQVTLKDLAEVAIRDGGGPALEQLRQELAKTARALAALHRCEARFSQVATFDQELAGVADVVSRLALSVPELEPAAAPLMARLRWLADTIPTDPRCCSHHDFRPAQVLLNDGRLGFIDFDGASMAEPALDLGRFRAKLRDIGISALAARGQGLHGQPLEANLALLDSLCEEFLEEYRAHAAVSPERVLLWETCDLFTALLHAWTKVRLARLKPRMAVLVHQLRSVPLLDLADHSG